MMMMVARMMMRMMTVMMCRNSHSSKSHVERLRESYLALERSIDLLVMEIERNAEENRPNG